MIKKQNKIFRNISTAREKEKEQVRINILNKVAPAGDILRILLLFESAT